ncbi:uncharacterized protein LOC6591590 [Drosophila persimilis]|uniref:uncharacterized protein LOC6591590 n=1 Tax=Drosophila persimilis TaxID=7234 RepID=UPI000F086123|nr:uncharacterized protein LOC6591590 [Drosophila persimilis]
MPQKVLTRRQRKAADATRQAEEEALKNPQPVTAVKGVKRVQAKPPEKQQQITPGGKPPAPTPLSPPKPPTSGRTGTAPINKTAKLTQKRTQSSKLVESIIYSKNPVPSGRLPKKMPEALNLEPKPLSGAKPRTAGSASASAPAAAVGPGTSTESEMWREIHPGHQKRAKEHLLSIWNKIQKHMGVSTMNSKNSHKTVNIPLLNKICEEIKSRWQGILPAEGEETQPEIYGRRQREVSPSLSSLSFTPSEMELIPQTLEAVENYLASVGTENEFDFEKSVQQADAAQISPQLQPELPENSVKKPEKAQKSVTIRPDDSIEIIGQTGYFVITGTDEQLAQKLIDLKDQGVTVEQSIQLPEGTEGIVLQQLEELLLNREQIIQKMHSKHDTLSMRREPREKKKLNKKA